MITITDINTLKTIRSKQPSNTIGFVPTMGALHEGHLSLIAEAKKHNDTVIVSIFVNPTQFNNASDYDNYPSTIEADKQQLENAQVDFLFLPTDSTMYPSGNHFSITPNQAIATQLEGEKRPGHFAGMLTIVMKLLLLTKPTHAYFGEKDFQQLKLVEQLTADFFLDTQIVPVKTMREASGLPMSSRNRRLNQADRQLAESVYSLLRTQPRDDLHALRNAITQLGVTIDYLEAIDQRLFLAMYIGEVRLIDNFPQETGPC